MNDCRGHHSARYDQPPAEKQLSFQKAAAHQGQESLHNRNTQRSIADFQL
jgi:hypothetical protein